MGNSAIEYNINPNRRNHCGVIINQSCLGGTGLTLDGGELAIHREVGIPRGRVIPESLKYLNDNEVQLLQAAGTKNLSSIR